MLPSLKSTGVRIVSCSKNERGDISVGDGDDHVGDFSVGISVGIHFLSSGLVSISHVAAHSKLNPLRWPAPACLD